MLRKLSQYWAKLSYIATLEVEASKSDVNAAVAKRNANEARHLADQLNKEADELESQAVAIEENIMTVDGEEEVRKPFYCHDRTLHHQM
jgi:hypothetical protein